MATPPVGLCGELRKIARALGLFLTKSFDVVQVGPKLICLLQRLRTPSAAAALDVRAVGREVRAEDQHRVAGIEERLAEELLEDLGAGPDDDVLGRDVDAEFLVVIRRDRLAERRQAQRGAVVRLVGAGWPRCRPSSALRGARKGAVADLQFDDVLALGLEAAGDGQDVEGGFGRQARRTAERGV